MASSTEKQHEGRKSSREEAQSKELEEIRTRTMYKMVDSLSMSIDGQNTTRNFVYLTHSQSFMFNSVSIKKLLSALELRHEPQLCIRFLSSAFGLEFSKSQSIGRKRTGRHSDDPAFIEHGARGSIYPPVCNPRDMLEADSMLLQFCKEVVLPLAISTNAVILMQGSSECDLAMTFQRACQGLFARYGTDNLPFTIICVQSATAFAGTVARDTKKQTIASQYLEKSSVARPKRIMKAVENRFGSNAETWSAYEAVAWCTHYLLCESVVGQDLDPTTLKKDSSDFDNIMMLISSAFSANIPTICFSTYGINPSASFGRGGNRFASVCNLLKQEIPVVFLDVRERLIQHVADHEINDKHPVAILLKNAGKGSAASADSITDKSQSVYQVNEKSRLKDKVLELAMGDHKRLGEELLQVRPVVGNDSVCLCDAWDNCMLAHFKMIIDADFSSATIGPNGEALKKGGIDAREKIVDGQASNTLPLFQMIKRMELNEVSTGDGLSNSDKKAIERVTSFLAYEDLRQHWEATSQDDKDKIKAQFGITTGEEFYMEAIRDKSNYWNDMLKSPYMKGASVHDLAGVRNLVDSLTRADRLPKRNTYETLLILRDAWCVYDLFTFYASKMKARAKYSYVVFLSNGLFLTYLSVYGSALVEYGLPPTVNILQKTFDSVSLTLFLFSLLGSLIAGYIAYVDPVKRWKELRLLSQQLKRDIWQFRSRTGKFRTATRDGAGKKRFAERVLRARIMMYREQALERANAKGFDMLKEPKERIFVHGQFSLPHRPQGCCKSRGIEHIEHRDDNFYSPVKPEEYLEWRLKPLLKFYRRRLPMYARGDGISHALLSIYAMLSAVLSYGNMTAAVALLAQVSSIQLNFMEFNDVKKKLMRYNGIIAGLENKILWWNSLTKVEKASQLTVNELVNGVEEMIAGEQQAWLAAHMKQKDEKNEATKKPEKNKAKVQDDPEKKSGINMA
jgi:hypothetical protein